MATFLKRNEILTERAMTLPGRFYHSPEIHAEELEKIFNQRWLCVGREDRLTEPGDFFVQPIGVEEALVLRDQSGRLRAFYNVCRHRGTRLCEARDGTLPGTILCPYHAWAYSLDGRLVGAPSTNDIPGFDKTEYPLHPIALRTWQGFVFISLAQDPPPFEETFEGLDDRASLYNLSNLKLFREIVYDVNANWKLLVQNYQECYHCAPVHPGLAKLTPPTSGENDLIEGPLLGGYMELNEGTGSMTMSGRACGVPVSDLPAEELHRVYYYSIFPQMLLSLHPDYVMFHTLWPVDLTHTRITCSWLFHADSLNRTEFDPADGVAFWDMTNRQDWHICEESQKGILSRMYRPGPYSARECLSHRFDLEVLKALGRERTSNE